jgi:hypothetical protein
MQVYLGRVISRVSVSLSAGGGFLFFELKKEDIIKKAIMFLGIFIFITVSPYAGINDGLVGAEDIKPPQLTEFWMSSTSVDVTGGSSFVTFFAHRTDDVSGMDGGGVVVQSPLGIQTQSSTWVTTPSSGSAMDGIYQMTVTMPQFAEAGQGHVFYMVLQDKAGNRNEIHADALQTMGLQLYLMVTSEIPTSIYLYSFNAIQRVNKVALAWATASEIDNAGFNLYRAESADGKYTKINPSLIPAQGSTTSGATYQFIDNDVRNRKTYYYKLEDIDLNGKSTMHGPVSAVMKRKGFGIGDQEFGVREMRILDCGVRNEDPPVNSIL